MQRSFRTSLALGLSAASAIGLASCTPDSQVPTDAANTPGCTLAVGTVATWFKLGSVTLDGEVTPADSINFSDQPNCSFYVWSARMFLWLTSPTPPSYGGGGGRIFASPAFFDVSPENALHQRTLIKHHVGLMPFLSARVGQKGAHEQLIIRDKRSGRLFEQAPAQVSARGLPQILNTRNQLVEIQRGVLRNGQVVLFDPQGRQIDFLRSRKELQAGDIPALNRITIAGHAILFDLFGDVLQAEQAEADTGVVMAQNNSLIYYTIEVNDVYAYFASGVKSGAISAAHFPISATDETPISSYAATKGVSSFPDPEALAIELKTAWVEASSLPSGCNYITMSAKIPTYDTTDPTKWKVSGSTTKTMAMIGMHVVGSTGSTNPANSVHGHPEMIWATFEHKCNAPVGGGGYTYNGASLNESGPSETGPWLLSSSNNPGSPNQMRQSYNDSVTPHEVDSLNPPQTVGPSDVTRVMPWGMPGSNATSNTQIIALDHSVLSQIAAGDVRGNYIMTGATWRIFGGIIAAQVGTNKLANTTMETFAQGSNCFSCHVGGSAPAQFLGDNSGNGLSHIFGELQSLP